MAVYQTGTSTDVTDLLSKLRTFALANGWTQDFSGARTAGSGNALQMHKAGMYVTIFTDTTAGPYYDPGPYIGVYGHDTYNAGNGTESQAGASRKSSCNGLGGPFTAYHFISGSELGAEYLYVIVETSSGVFKHFGTGAMVTFGTVANGQFVHAARWSYEPGGDIISNPDQNGHNIPFDSGGSTGGGTSPGCSIRVDADSISPRWMEGLQTAGTSGRRLLGGVRPLGSTNPQARELWRYAASALTGRNMFFRCLMGAERIGGLFNLVGYPPGIRWCNLTYLSPNDVVALGSENWKAFPVIRKNGALTQPNSGTYGYVYKVN